MVDKHLRRSKVLCVKGGEGEAGEESSSATSWRADLLHYLAFFYFIHFNGNDQTKGQQFEGDNILFGRLILSHL